MIVGGFALDLYCDNQMEEGTRQERWEHMGSDEFPGPGRATFVHEESGAKARAIARQAVGSWNYRADGHCALHASKLAVCCQQ
jgi:hypothetical protein